MIPAAFCWTRIGVESGQSVDAILRRKQMEQRVARCFVWGIGNALGEAPHALAARGAPKVVFSPIAGPPAAHDTAPTALVAWRAYVDHRGAARPLPPGVLVTSRAHGPVGKAKLRHYALFCSTSEPLRVREHGVVDITELRNLVSRNAVGSSQTTAIVERAHPRARPRLHSRGHRRPHRPLPRHPHRSRPDHGRRARRPADVRRRRGRDRVDHGGP